MNIFLSWGAEMKTYDPNHSQALLPTLCSTQNGCRYNAQACPSYLFKLPL